MLPEGKDLDNRGWWSSYRGPVLILATKRPSRRKWMEEWAKAANLITMRDVPSSVLEWIHQHRDIDSVPHGGIIGKADLVDCVTTWLTA